MVRYQASCLSSPLIACRSIRQSGQFRVRVRSRRDDSRWPEGAGEVPHPRETEPISSECQPVIVAASLSQPKARFWTCKPEVTGASMRQAVPVQAAALASSYNSSAWLRPTQLGKAPCMPVRFRLISLTRNTGMQRFGQKLGESSDWGEMARESRELLTECGR